MKSQNTTLKKREKVGNHLLKWIEGARCLHSVHKACLNSPTENKNHKKLPFVLCWKLEIKHCIAKKLLNSVLSHTAEAVTSAIFRWGGFQVLTVQFCGCIPRPGAITPANSRFAFLWNVSPQHGQKKPQKLCALSGVSKFLKVCIFGWKHGRVTQCFTLKLQTSEALGSFPSEGV